MSNENLKEYLRHMKNLSENDENLETKISDLNCKYKLMQQKKMSLFDTYIHNFKNFHLIDNFYYLNTHPDDIANDFLNNEKTGYKFQKSKEYTRTINGITRTYKEKIYNNNNEIIKEITHPDGKKETIKTPYLKQ